MKELPVVSVNGKLLHASDARISPFDRGVRMGDGLFETIRVRSGRILRLGDHLNRLLSSCVALDFPAPDHGGLVQAALDFMHKTGIREGALRITLTRGEAGGVWPSGDVSPLLLITASEGVPYPPAALETGLKAAVIDDPVRVQGLLSRHKVTSYIPSIIARRLALEQGADVAIMLNCDGNVAEADCANIFVVTDDDEIVTPPVDEGALPGISRARLLKAMPEIEERPVSADDLYDALEVVFTNALMPAAAAASVDETPLEEREFFRRALAALERDADRENSP